MPRKIKRFKLCPFCGKRIPQIYLKHHKTVCRVKRGLEEPVEVKEVNLDELFKQKRESEKR